MEVASPLTHSMPPILSNSSSPFLGSYFLLKPMFLRGFSGSLHLVLLLALLMSFVSGKFGVRRVSDQETRFNKNVKRDLLCYKQKAAFFCCLCISVLNLVCCLLSYSYGCKNGCSGDELVTLLDLALRTLSWGALSVYRHIQSADKLLEEPLLNENGNSTEFRGGDSVTPYSNAGLISILTFSWMGSLIAAGNNKTLDLEDFPQLLHQDIVVAAFSVFRNKFESGSSAATRVSAFNLVKTLFLSAWKEILWTDLFVQCLNGHKEFKNQGNFLASAFLTAKLIERLSQRHWSFKLQQVAMRIRSVIVAMIYNKGLTHSCQAEQGHTSGEIINFVTVDAERIGAFFQYLYDPWLVIVQVSLALFILYKHLGLASLATLLATFIVMLMSYPLGKLEEKLEENLMKAKDKRMKATTEILRNMRILKFQAWEMKVLSKIVELRKTEAGWLKKYVYATALVSFVFWSAPSFVSLATFATCMLMGIPLELGKILTALATFKMLQEPIIHLPHPISTIVQTKVSLYRIASFLRLDYLPSDAVEELPRDGSNTAIEIADGNFSWDLSGRNNIKRYKLESLPRYEGCGEVSKISGSVKLGWTKDYVAQSPWIQNGTIEENILFGKEIERKRYESILEACSLKKDLEILSFGDQTVIGERGINLSGGQKQRIEIARALYQDAYIYLFDDPFSAVDAHTGSHLFSMSCFCDPTLVHLIFQLSGSAFGNESVSKEHDGFSNTDGFTPKKREKQGFRKNVLQVISNYWITWATSISKDAKPPCSTEEISVDLQIPYQVWTVAFSMVNLLGTVAVMSPVAWQKYYIPSARELSRLIGVCKAPVIQHLAETISGSTTIRSFSQQSRFRELNMKLTDAYSRPKFHSAGAIQWLGFRLDMFYSITFALYLFILISFPKGTDLDSICPSPLVLRGLTCTLPGGKKSGIVGRTGSRKSTLIQALFQIVEPAAGQIVVDGVNISSIGLHNLRSRLSIIPQDPTMFDGTIRSNLDRLGSYSEEEIWELVCLGSVLLEKSKVLVLDEATASVDTATDNSIQQIIRQHFSDCTVITIAHRITSILDSDMVLLLSDGLVEEHDSPGKLLANKSSAFAKLVAEYTDRSNTSF
ncbi:multidrug resistance-associated protein 2, 6 (mrp2, 6), abc-transoprter, putative [Ricinus communis]|uniref:ABC-type xenobiotic transporter n=1 Tax=Ricinus communis TaxID=3988 RepID=B9RW23_RICCO|nr:multidrug resistance-associated protein 2, 6 (mrp2, 6), abc-transoprter, putative [Ricinus communis]